MRPRAENPGPFHEGELALQRATGERDAGAVNGQIVVPRIIPHAFGFIARQELAVVATVDGDGRPWASVLLGPPGSFTVPDETRVELASSAARPDDPLWENLRRDPRVGMLFVEVASRRRYRVNGVVADPLADPLTVEVREALPNCPKYITRRHLTIGAAPVDTATTPRTGTATTPRADTGTGGTDGTDGTDATTGAVLGDEERGIIAAADVAFVATADPEGQLDASHRGGRPGFVELRGGDLWIPDYPGNSMFMTLGNLRLNPRAGLLFVDFTGGRSLQLTGTTALDLKVDDPGGRTGGTGRAWTFTPTAWRNAPLPATVHTDLPELSPFDP